MTKNMILKQVIAHLVAVTAVVTAAAVVDAAPLRRFQVDQRGDFVLFGNTTGWECDSGVPAPTVGTVGACGANTGETSPDVFWRSQDENNPPTAIANNTVTVTQARSTAVLQLPAGAQVTYARLYWAAPRPTPNAPNDSQVLVERVGAGAFMTTVSSDSSSNVTTTTGLIDTFYQSTADITQLVQARGVGGYRVSGIDTKEFAGLANNRLFIGWSVVVFYKLDTDPPRNLTLFDGLDPVQPGQSVNILLSGFLVPDAGFDAKLGVVGYEGDASISGDQLRFNGTLLGGNAASANPTNNFFNSTRSYLGALVSNAGDLPRLTGAPRSLSGLDLDVVDVTSLLQKGATMATIQASSTNEFYVTGAFVTSISTFKPDFSSTGKTFSNLTRADGTVRPGDLLEYTITATNTGNDVATGAFVTDTIPAGLTYVPGTLTISAGANPGIKTDQVADDQGEYNAATRTLTVRLGTGANAIIGGTMLVGASSTIKFRATIEASASGIINNQAVVVAAGMAGAPQTPFPSDADPATPGPQATPAPIDKCISNADCGGTTPLCRNGALQHPWICVECLTAANCGVATKPVCLAATGLCGACSADLDCGGGTTPACQSTGRCGQCSASNKTLCTGTTPNCDDAAGLCVGCSSSADCSGATPICNATTKACRACSQDSECPMMTPACQSTGACGLCSATNKQRCTGATPACNPTTVACVECVANTDCPMARAVCDLPTHTCKGCLTDADCRAPTPACLMGTCGACRADGDCGATTSGRICEPGAVSRCAPGCRGAGGNGCPTGFLCSSATNLPGACVVVVNQRMDAAANDTAGDAPARVDMFTDGSSPVVDAVTSPDLMSRGDAVTASDLGLPRDSATTDAPTESTGDAAVQSRDLRPRVDTASAGIDGYLAGGGCKCDIGRDSSGASGLWGLAGILGLVIAGRRRRSRVR